MLPKGVGVEYSSTTLSVNPRHVILELFVVGEDLRFHSKWVVLVAQIEFRQQKHDKVFKFFCSFYLIDVGRGQHGCSNTAEKLHDIIPQVFLHWPIISLHPFQNSLNDIHFWLTHYCSWIQHQSELIGIQFTQLSILMKMLKIEADELNALIVQPFYIVLQSKSKPRNGIFWTNFCYHEIDAKSSQVFDQILVRQKRQWDDIFLIKLHPPGVQELKEFWECLLTITCLLQTEVRGGAPNL